MSEGLAQGPYTTARVGFAPANLTVGSHAGRAISFYILFNTAAA